MDFPGHEEAIAVLSKAEAELTALGYKVDFKKSFCKEEGPPEYANTHFCLKFEAIKWKWENESAAKTRYQRRVLKTLSARAFLLRM